MVDGDPGFDIWGMDVARFGDWATLRYTNAKVRENYSRRFSIRFPNEELPAARPQQTTPLYDVMVRDNRAVMGDSWGLETPLWFAPRPKKPTMPSPSTAPTISSTSAEVCAVRKALASPRSPTSPSTVSPARAPRPGCRT
jgi:dimethylglycine dehydrogenase